MRHLTIERLPDAGPQVAMYATGIDPVIAPNTAHRDASLKLNPKTTGASMPSVILTAARLIENHSRAA